MKTINNWLKINCNACEKQFKQIKLFLMIKYQNKTIPSKELILKEHEEWSKIVNKNYAAKIPLEDLALNFITTITPNSMQLLVLQHLAKENFELTSKYSGDLELLSFYYNYFHSDISGVSSLQQAAINQIMKNSLTNLIKIDALEAFIYFLNNYYPNPQPIISELLPLGKPFNNSTYQYLINKQEQQVA